VRGALPASGDNVTYCKRILINIKDKYNYKASSQLQNERKSIFLQAKAVETARQKRRKEGEITKARGTGRRATASAPARWQ
jgi:hypothetical protein